MTNVKFSTYLEDDVRTDEWKFTETGEVAKRVFLDRAMLEENINFNMRTQDPARPDTLSFLKNSHGTILQANLPDVGVIQVSYRRHEGYSVPTEVTVSHTNGLAEKVGYNLDDGGRGTAQRQDGNRARLDGTDGWLTENFSSGITVVTHKSVYTDEKTGSRAFPILSPYRMHVAISIPGFAYELIDSIESPFNRSLGVVDDAGDHASVFTLASQGVTRDVYREKT